MGEEHEERQGQQAGRAGKWEVGSTLPRAAQESFPAQVLPPPTHHVRKVGAVQAVCEQAAPLQLHVRHPAAVGGLQGRSHAAQRQVLCREAGEVHKRQGRSGQARHGRVRCRSGRVFASSNQAAGSSTIAVPHGSAATGGGAGHISQPARQQAAATHPPGCA